jgi:hypothetical protein
MEQIRKDLRPWFRGFVASCPRPNNPTFVNYLFLIRRKKDESYFSSGTALLPSGVKLLIQEVNSSDNPGRPKTALFREVVSRGKVPTQESILSELVLVVSGLEPPEAEITQPTVGAKGIV